MCNNNFVFLGDMSIEQVIRRFEVEFEKWGKVLGTFILDVSSLMSTKEIDLELNGAYDNYDQPKVDEVINLFVQSLKKRKINTVVIFGETMSTPYRRRHTLFEKEGINMIILKSATADDEYVSGSMFLIKANMNKSICIEHEEDGYFNAEEL